MHNEAYEIVCAGDPQAVIWLIIIAATVIVQIVKAGKRLTRTPPEPGPPGQEPVAPQDELREFLENLAGTRRAPPAQSPPRRATAPPAARRSAPPPPPPLPPRAAPAPARMRRAAVAPIPGQAEGKASSSFSLRTKTRFESGVISTADLNGTRNLRRAIALMEVFAKPRALRPPGM